MSFLLFVLSMIIILLAKQTWTSLSTIHFSFLAIVVHKVHTNCLEISTNKVYIFRHVRFIENEFPDPILITKHQSLKPLFIHGLPLQHPNLLFHLGMPTNSQPTNTSCATSHHLTISCLWILCSHILPWKVTHQIPPHKLLQLLFPQPLHLSLVPTHLTVSRSQNNIYIQEKVYPTTERPLSNFIFSWI